MTARFRDGPSYRKFIFGLEAGFACDVLQWGKLAQVKKAFSSAGQFFISTQSLLLLSTTMHSLAYVQDIGAGDLRISVDLDEGCFCNDGSGRGANMGCDKKAAKEYEGGCKENEFALKDIKAGDELECSYGEFAVPTGWRKFGL